jgi:glycosyltransferase involved in cell wall biosynthesis
MVQPIEGHEPLAESVRTDTWIVIPAYNEGMRLGGVLDSLLAAWPNVVVVDDGSTDRTRAETLRRAAWYLRHEMNLGQGAALATGIRFALAKNAHFIVTYDADGQHCPEDVPALIAALQSGDTDFALGSRFLGTAPGIPLSRRILLKMAIIFTRLTSGMVLTDVHNGLRAMTRRGAESLKITLNGMEHASQLLEQIRRSGLRFCEVPVTIRYTSESLDKGQRTSQALAVAARLFLGRIGR